jgi:heme/copper-type cytochrome/quinol oxidase subunit 4
MEEIMQAIFKFLSALFVIGFVIGLLFAGSIWWMFR